MIRIINGTTRIGNEVFTSSSGNIEADEAVESRLVSLGIAEYVTPVATPITDDFKSVPSENASETEEPAESLYEGEADEAVDDTSIPEYSIDSPMSELRALMKENGLSAKVGITKADMVAALDEIFSDAPVLNAEEPV